MSYICSMFENYKEEPSIELNCWTQTEKTTICSHAGIIFLSGYSFVKEISIKKKETDNQRSRISISLEYRCFSRVGVIFFFLGLIIKHTLRYYFHPTLFSRASIAIYCRSPWHLQLDCREHFLKSLLILLSWISLSQSSVFSFSRLPYMLLSYVSVCIFILY